MSSLEPFLKRSLVILLFLGLTEACVPRQVAMEEKIKLLKGIVGLMSRLSPDGFRQNIISSSKTSPLVTTPDRTEEEMKILKQILGLLSLQVLNEETSNCKEEVKSSPATTTAKALVRSSGWSFWRCAYMMVTFLFVSYNKGDWCYCHYCNPDLDLRYCMAGKRISTFATGSPDRRQRGLKGPSFMFWAWPPTVPFQSRRLEVKARDCARREARGSPLSRCPRALCRLVRTVACAVSALSPLGAPGARLRAPGEARGRSLTGLQVALGAEASCPEGTPAGPEGECAGAGPQLLSGSEAAVRRRTQERSR
nr:uncharacterized protein LOC110559116 [Meriones unguiculatus]